MDPFNVMEIMENFGTAEIAQPGTFTYRIFLMPVALLAGILGYVMVNLAFCWNQFLVAPSQVTVPTELVEIVQYIK